jgi:hypothetical protein
LGGPSKDGLQLSPPSLDHEEQREFIEAGVFGREVPGSREGLPVAFRLSREAREVEITEVRVGQEVSRRRREDRPRADVVDDGASKARVEGRAANPSVVVDRAGNISELPRIDKGGWRWAGDSVAGGRGASQVVDDLPGLVPAWGRVTGRDIAGQAKPLVVRLPGRHAASAVGA